MKKNKINEDEQENIATDVIEERQEDLDKEPSDKLIEAALPLFAMKGYAAVTVRELADAAHVNSALVSYYFGGKEKLYAAVLESQVSLVGRIVEKIGKENLSTVDSLMRYVQEIIVVFHQCPYLFRLMSGELISPTACFETVVKKEITKLFTFLRQILRKGVECGELRPELDIEYAVISFVGIINFYLIIRPLASKILHPDEQQDAHYILQAVNIYLNGVMENGQ
ncbi:TetR/AcrR family transcriptional regulator [Sporomusaceae bacterium BoRhaA]|uniref:CerR family C-terminal domain-containing protein n=1 Tax=Pelorhabdus rhamnosifermentans TaxID=2772457 RepID=UPI001C0600CF|nr:CerR family C-terminal domain-containing protein [Pelorhabdus rhamnosifermentans]MBU2703591.1 TetR/AcrR family transcriptional regulator [Pelorhabdus rhamnosifermentans]